ncbi:hypothetical protein G7085_19055 [Tessaracoccus sp. HDW20]|uniref:ATP-binding protein n=1 Tax=Tessaracoccus coleopterorum TaxID=2714950 RepID=UPI0018D32B0D|nr:ATP-binding protein [Tessaracoccus coleopterorum]NHB85932.1 hypothetical protein [Tessaracoccus coleopterorum]
MQRPIELALAIVAIVFLQRPLIALFETRDPILALGLVVIFTAQLLVAVDCLVPRNRSWMVVALSIIATAVLVLGQLGQPEGPAVWRTDVWLGTQLVYLALLYPKGWQLPVLGASALVGFLTLATARDLDWELQFLSILFLIGSLVLLALGRLFVSAIAEDYLRSQQDRVREERAHELARARAEALSTIRRDAHDSILHSLQLVARGPSGVAPEQIRSSCRTTGSMLTGLPEVAAEDHSEHLDESLRNRLAAGPAKLEWDLQRVSVPLHIADALIGAGLEAVRNVVKHTPDPGAVVTLRSTPQSVRLEIRDHGPGFDTAAVPASSMGIRESIGARMVAVGGEAHIVSDPTGTTVTLSWPAAEPQARNVLGPRARRMLSLVPLPLVFASLIHVTITHPGMSTLQTFVPWALLAAVVLLACGRVRRRGLSDAEAWILCAVALVGLAYNYLIVGSAGEDVWSIWVPSLAGSMAILALPGRRIGTALTMAGVLVGGHVLMSIVTLGWQTTFVGHFGAIVSLGIDVIITLVLVFSTAAVARYEWRDLQQRARIAQQQRISAEREGIWRDWLTRANSLAGGFLDGVASGRLLTGSPSTAAQALRLEARLRDELRLWPGEAGVAAELDRLRGRGWRCRFDLETPGLESRKGLATVLRQLSTRRNPDSSWPSHRGATVPSSRSPPRHCPRSTRRRRPMGRRRRRGLHPATAARRRGGFRMTGLIRVAILDDHEFILHSVRALAEDIPASRSCSPARTAGPSSRPPLRRHRTSR